MDDVPMTFQRLEDMDLKYVSVTIHTESGCDPEEGEYSMSLLGSTSALDISSLGGVDDISLIKDCIENDVDLSNLPIEGCTTVTLKESGEWEGYNWHKYYAVERIVKEEY